MENSLFEEAGEESEGKLSLENFPEAGSALINKPWEGSLGVQPMAHISRNRCRAGLRAWKRGALERGACGGSGPARTHLGRRRVGLCPRGAQQMSRPSAVRFQAQSVRPWGGKKDFTGGFVGSAAVGWLWALSSRCWDRAGTESGQKLPFANCPGRSCRIFQKISEQIHLKGSTVCL